MTDPIFSPSSAPGANPAASPSSQNEIGKEAFLKLLTTQMSNQNPLDPVKGQEFASQLAQFSSVEQLTQINAHLKGQAGEGRNNLLALHKNRAADMLGHRVEASGKDVAFKEGGEVPLSFSLPVSVEKARLVVTNSSGEQVLDHSLGELASGDHEVIWKGVRSGGAQAPSGSYSFQITYGSEGSKTAETLLAGKVKSVRFAGELPTLQVGGASISLNQVKSVASTPDS